jgi:hypothetical protein
MHQAEALPIELAEGGNVGANTNDSKKRDLKVFLFVAQHSVLLFFVHFIQCSGSGSAGSVCFGPPGSGSGSGSESFHHQANKVRKTLITRYSFVNLSCLILNTGVYVLVPSKNTRKINLRYYLLTS